MCKKILCCPKYVAARSLPCLWHGCLQLITRCTPCATHPALRAVQRRGHGPHTAKRVRQPSKVCKHCRHSSTPGRLLHNTTQHPCSPVHPLWRHAAVWSVGWASTRRSRPNWRGRRAQERGLRRRAQAALHLTAALRARAWCSRPLRGSRARAWSRWQLRAWVRWQQPAWLRSPTPRQPPWPQPPPCSPRSRLPARADRVVPDCCSAAAGASLRTAGHPRGPQARAARPRARQACWQQCCGAHRNLGQGAECSAGSPRSGLTPHHGRGRSAYRSGAATPHL